MEPATPTSSQVPFVPGTPSTPALQIDEGISVEVEQSPVVSEVSPSKSTSSHSHSGKNPLVPGLASPQRPTTPTRNMDSSIHMLDQEVYRGFEMPSTSRAETSHFNQFLEQAADEIPDQILSSPTERCNSQDIGLMDIPHVGHETVAASNYPGMSQPSLSITRQENLTLTSVLERIPHTYLVGEEVDPNQSLSLMILEESGLPPLIASSSQEDAPAHTASEEAHTVTQIENPIGSGKRRRPKYSLTGSMFKKHPVLKFSATGPLDRDKTPYKWWCRVCKTELSLMSRGSLELVSHYRSESHLVKEHRIRMEVPGMALFDRDERELLGLSLQEAKKKAKDTYPIAPQLDPCRPLFGQESVPDFSAATSPTAKILSQITILEFGLRHGGHIHSLTGIYDELVRFNSMSHLCTQNWSPERLFVSICHC